MPIERATVLRATGPMRNRIAFFPEKAGRTDPFLALAEDWVSPEGGFPTHPHRGFETVTFVLEGSQQHQDSTGSKGVLHAGDVQWMTAGRGVLHSEMPMSEGFHGLQLWVNLPAAEKMRAPRYQNLPAARIPVVATAGAHLRVVAGAHDGVRGVAETVTPMTVLDIQLDEAATFTREAAHRVIVYVFGGGLDGAPDGSVLYLEPGPSTLTALGTGGARLLWMEGAPLGEPIVARGPFVMNTAKQIEEAFEDMRAGPLGRRSQQYTEAQ